MLKQAAFVLLSPAIFAGYAYQEWQYKREEQKEKREAEAERRAQAEPPTTRRWSVGDVLLHTSFGHGAVTRTFGSGDNMSIAVKFPRMGWKIFDPTHPEFKARVKPLV